MDALLDVASELLPVEGAPPPDGESEKDAERCVQAVVIEIIVCLRVNVYVEV
jgi:hypothetical protein